MKKDEKKKKDNFNFCLRILEELRWKVGGQVAGMVLIKRYEVLQGALPERLHVLNAVRQSVSTRSARVPQRRKEGRH